MIRVQSSHLVAPCSSMNQAFAAIRSAPTMPLDKGATSTSGALFHSQQGYALRRPFDQPLRQEKFGDCDGIVRGGSMLAS